MRRLDQSKLDGRAYHEIVGVLRDGGVVCFPTDTLYGLSVDTSNADAFERLYHVKGRSREMPVILFVDSIDRVGELADPPAEFGALARRFWPGPISFVLEARSGVDSWITAKTHSVAVRWPASEIATRIVAGLGRAITSTSANRSGQPPLRSADSVATQLSEIDLLVDGGTLPERPASTVIDLRISPPAILRDGQIPGSEVQRFLFGERQEPPS